MARPPKTQRWRFILYTYDLWSDGEGGMTVNDVYKQGEIEITAHLGIPAYMAMNRAIYTISDRQLNRAIGARGLTWDGDDEYVLYAADRKGNPVCELRRVKEN